MPGKTERGSIFRLPVYLPDAAWHGHPSLAVRWPGVLAGHKALVQGTFQMVANRHGSGTDAAVQNRARREYAATFGLSELPHKHHQVLFFLPIQL